MPRCMACNGCFNQADKYNCDKCKWCLDNPRLGGPNRWHQLCEFRWCVNNVRKAKGKEDVEREGMDGMKAISEVSMKEIDLSSMLVAFNHKRNFQCIFCRETVSIPVGDYDKFKNHMLKTHNVHYDFEALLSFNFIDEQENMEITEKGADKVTNTNKTFYCVFCKDITIVSVQTFAEHMEIDHEMFFQHGILLSNHFITLQEKEDIIKRVKSKAEKIIINLHGKIWETINLEETEMVTPWYCNKCRKICTSKQRFERHIRKTCKKCGKCFIKLRDFKEHMKKMTRDSNVDCTITSFPCNQCDLTFRKNKTLITHIAKRHTARIRKVFQCDDCPRQFVGPKKFQKHLKFRRNCKAPPKEDLKCPKCNKYFLKLSNLKCHMNLLNSCYSKIVCEKCSKHVREHSYEIHLEKHDREQKKEEVIDLTCKNCLKSFISKAGAKYHYEHRDCKKVIECLKCGRKLSKQRYDNHFSLSCVLEECPKCGEKFTKARLQKHIEKRTSCVEIKCKICQSSFVLVDKLELHMFKKHGENPGASDETWKGIPCQFCTKRFVDETSMRKHRLKKHQEMTSDEYCQFCPRLINRNFLIQHLKWKHPTEIAAIVKEKETKVTEMKDYKDNQSNQVLGTKCNTCNYIAKNRHGLTIHMTANPSHVRLKSK